MSEHLEPPGETRRALRAIVLGSVLGALLALLGRSRDHRARRDA